MLYSFYKKRRERLEQKLEAAKEREQKALEREMKSDRERRENLKGVPGHFAHGLNFYKYFWIFFLCCF